MVSYIELSISALVLLFYVLIIYFFVNPTREEGVIEIKLKVLNTIMLNELEIRRLSFLNNSEEIKNILEKEIGNNLYDFEVLICDEIDYDSCKLDINAKEVYTVSYLFSNNITDFKNIELRIYLWKNA